MHGALPPSLFYRLLELEDLSALLAMRNAVLADLSHPDLYVREDDEILFVLGHLLHAGRTVGVFQGDSLVAYAMLGLPTAADPDNLGRVAGLDPDDFGTVAHLSGCMVRAAWRGHGLQRLLLTARLAYARQEGRRLCMAVVSLHNHASRQNMLSRGLHLQWIGTTGGLLRQVMLTDLREGLQVDRSEGHWVPSDDVVAQQALVGAGFVGVAQRRAARGTELLLARRLQPVPRPVAIDPPGRERRAPAGGVSLAVPQQLL